MRVVIDARTACDAFPGIGRYVANLVRALGEIATTHTFIVLYNPRARNTRHPLDTLSPQIQLFATDVPIFSMREQIEIPRILRRLGADLYHATYYVRPYTSMVCPSVLTLYDAIPHLFPTEVSRRARLLYGLLTHAALRASQRYITISASARDDLQSAVGLDPARTTVVPLAAAANFRPQSSATIAAVRHRYAIPERYVLSVSTGKPHKNQLGLVEAWEKVRHDPVARATQLVVAGHHDPRYPHARDRAIALQMGDQIAFLPDVAEGDLPALYSGTTAFILPSFYEGFGLPLLEAMACGAPSISSRTASIPEVAGDAALLVDPYDHDAIATALRTLLTDAHLRERLHHDGRARATQFSWRHTAELTLAVYLEAMHTRAHN